MKKPGMTTRQLVRELDDREGLSRVRSRVQRLIDKWAPKVGAHPREWELRKMGRYWGSADKVAQSIAINPDLAKLPPQYLEYIVVHELTHLVTDGHDRRFYEIMDRLLPRWRSLHEKIEEPLTRYS